MYPLISIIIPIYRIEAHLERCVDSVLCQSYTNLEIILVDDGSTDNCPIICDKYAQKDSRIAVIHKPNGGLSDARNAGLDKSKGDFIYFLDGDDFIGPNTIQTLYQAIQSDSKIAIAIGYFTAVYNNDDYKIYQAKWIFNDYQIIKSKDFAFKILSEQSNFAATAKLYRSNLLKHVRFQLNKKNEDTLFAVDLIPIIESHNFSCIDVPDYSYFYRQRNGSICHNTTDPIEWHSINNYQDILNKYSHRQNLVELLRKKQYELSLQLQTILIKDKNSGIFKENQKFLNNIPSKFVLKNFPLTFFIYFLLVKFTPKLAAFLIYLKQH